MGDRPTVDFVHLGPVRHGVRRYGELLADAVARRVPVGRCALGEAEAADGRVGRLPIDSPGADIAHLQFSDHLVEVTEFQRVVSALRAGRPSRRIVATFHDCPGVGHDRGKVDAHRRAAYARALEAVDAAVVCSRHERRALGVRANVSVIAHLVEDRRVAERVPTPAQTPTVGVLGFVYPRKGHAEVIDACSRSARSPDLVILGGASTGHHDLLDQLVEQARGCDVRCTVTGWIDEELLSDRLVDVDVPVVAHPAPSASGSLATWLSAGRRPIVAASRYGRELDRCAPGTLTLFDPASGPEALRDAIDRAIGSPATTRGAVTPSAMRASAIAEAHLDLYRSLP